MNMELIIMDKQGVKMHATGRTTKLYAMGDYADQFTEFLKSCDDVGLIIVVIQLGKIKKWDGVMQVHNAFFGTKLLMESIMNNDLKDIEDFRQGPISIYILESYDLF
ncbi:hypothetical protein Tco_0527997 [Tanacetum coccineum]